MLLRSRVPTPKKVVALMESLLRKVNIANYMGRLIVVAERRIRLI